ncbi:hypothetical protein [Cellulomonas sp. URHB0016]
MTKVEIVVDGDLVVLVVEDEVVVAMQARTAYRVAEAVSDAAWQITHPERPRPRRRPA